ncbi:apolipoprotein N-acyltransferase [Paracoccus spongiarum]|uniref:Apolipoprotein N-acyltransferase n=1 Tax=Paracoccus spongiarum TaxID=3064387 RepID=A0ABT9JAJ0_9RHOB|nr:apolipoprotein N-acyltransferase [Paracoccus sp. 2205BS29-5]MDP5306740.1 apolipoprotein N-acyltransferase [Paracoccus sp. 2205BS29-5]
MPGLRRSLLRPPRLPRRSRPPLAQLALDFGLGLVAALGLAPFGIWGATLTALALLLWRLSRARPAQAFWHALAAGLGWFGLSMCWIVEPFLVEPETYGWMAPFALILTAAGGALFWAIPVRVAAWLALGWRWRLVATIAALVLSDWLRGWIFTGLPWALVGHVWIDTPVAQMAAFGGAIGLSLLTLTLAGLPALLWRRGPAAIPGAAPGIALAIVMLGGIWAAGLARLARPLPEDTAIMLRIVQPNAEQRLKWDRDWSTVFFRRLLELSSEPGPRDLVIWPETAVNFLLDDAAGLLPSMAGAAGAPLLLGIQRQEGPRYLNSLALLDRDGQVLEVYDKFHLVPFGEYVPWGDWLARIGITAFAAQEGNGYSAGPGPALMAVPGLPSLQPLICYEAIFPQHLRGLPDRPGWILQVTNDGWFGRFSGPYQHLAQARLRAIETGLPLIRAANTGVSAVVDARGTLRDTLPLGAMGRIDAALPGALPPTPWLRLGPAPVIALAVLALLAAALQRRPSRGRAAPARRAAPANPIRS